MNVIELSENEIRFLRLNAQQLLFNEQKQRTDIKKVLQKNCGVQAQYVSDAVLALNVRMKDLCIKEIEEVIAHNKSIVRTWCMRGTLHFLAAEDFYWLMNLHGQLFIQKSQRRYNQLGIDTKKYNKFIEILYLMFVQKQSYTRDEIIDYFLTRSIKLEGQISYHLLRRAALDGIICFGPERMGEATYVLVENWLENSSENITEEESIIKLVRNYLNAYGPANISDLANWSGMPIKFLREGWNNLSDQMIKIKCGEQSLFMLDENLLFEKDKFKSPSVKLLPAYDTYLLGYQNRELILAPYAEKLVYRGGGLLRPAILIDGYIIGSWEKKKKGSNVEIKINTIYNLNKKEKDDLLDEIDKIGNFYDLSAKLIL